MYIPFLTCLCLRLCLSDCKCQYSSICSCRFALCSVCQTGRSSSLLNLDCDGCVSGRICWDYGGDLAAATGKWCMASRSCCQAWGCGPGRASCSAAVSQAWLARRGWPGVAGHSWRAKAWDSHRHRADMQCSVTINCAWKNLLSPLRTLIILLEFPLDCWYLWQRAMKTVMILEANSKYCLKFSVILMEVVNLYYLFTYSYIALPLYFLCNEWNRLSFSCMSFVESDKAYISLRELP